MVIQLPDASDLSSHVHFNPEQGKVWLDEQRGILQTLPAMATIWREIVTSIGVERSRNLFMRSGFRNGEIDAELARKQRPKASLTDLFLAGPQLHMLRGMAKVVPTKLEIDPAEKQFLMEFTWVDSYEVDISLAEMGVLDLPVCWNLLGYACGFSAAIMGFDILFREVSCRGKGDSECRIIGKPLAEWEDAADYGIFSSSDSLIETLYDLQAKSIGQSSFEDGSEERIFSTLIGESAVFKKMCTMANKVATSKASVLLTGETGVGKEMIAKGIHMHSERSEMPFIALNCAAIPQELLEAELFGVEKGAFTGATHARKGRFERANMGTIFLDEVVELSARAQASLLRVLQEREFEPVGGTQTRSVDVRIIAATNEDLEEAVKLGKFRADLFYRLNVFPLHIPPLRERHDDIPLLVEFFVDKYESLYTTKTLGLTDRAMGHLLNHPWPGNIRELENTIERGVILTEKNQRITADSLLSGTSAAAQPLDVDIAIDGLTATTSTGSGHSSWADTIFEQSVSMEAVEAELVRKAMALSEDNVSKAARLLGLSRPAFAYRLAKLQTPATE
ncbi:MAG: sigma 54-interacting transcriptional regulator [Gammaproteobacteria bacterium]|nr:sigma 54-interacting transcriptional regulator [Gammaproteobacteria bacterium]